MRYPRIRPACATLLAAACLFLLSVSRADEIPKAPPPKAIPNPRDNSKELELKLVGRTPEEILGVLNQLAQEWIARRGAVEVASRRFTLQAEELGKARLRLAALKEPDAKVVPLILRPADVDRASKIAQQLAEYHATRVQHLEEVVTSTTTLLKLGSEFDRAVKAALDCYDKIDMALSKVQEFPENKLPDALTGKRLHETVKRFQTLTTEINETRDKAKTDLSGLEAALKNEKEASAKATAMLEELKRNRESLLAAFAFEEQVKAMKAEPLVDEFHRLRKLLAEKMAAIKGDAADYAKATAAVAEARAKLNAITEPKVPQEEKLPASLSPLEQAARKLFAAQQQYSARVRTIEEREEKTRALVGMLDELEKKAVAYSTTLEATRQTAEQLAVVALEIDRRVGRGDLDPARAPLELAESLGATSEQAKLADAAPIHTAITKLKEERDALRKPNSEIDNIKMLTNTLLTQVSERIDLLTDLKKLAADYTTARKDRPESEQKRMDQRAAERMAKEAGEWDWFFALDHSPASTNIAALLDAYYKELIDLDEKQENLKQQKETLQKLVKLTQNEADDIAKLRSVLEKRSTQSEDMRKWDEWLASRLTPTGLKAEATTYHDETARLNAIGGSNARRVATLTGNAAPEVTQNASDEQSKLPSTGGEIGKARRELFEARVRGWIITGIKIGIVLLVALILPRIVIFILRRAIRSGTDAAGNPSPILAPLRGALRLGVWIAALALILSIFGFDVTALVIALAIGVLAVALAARPMIADVLGSVVIFAERRFKVGDVVRLADGEPARVVGITWRSTALKNSNGLVVSVPNRKVTETTVENLSRGTEAYDTLAVTISTDKDAGKVINVIRAAMAQCKNLTPDQGVTVLSYNHKGFVKVVQYRFWWFLKDYETRNKTRDEVFARIALGLAHEDMTGIEVTLA